MRRLDRCTVSMPWVLALALAACASAPRTACRPGERSVVAETLYFGTNIPDGGTVSDADWAAFVDQSVTPRFPEGLTMWTATGQWRGASGVTEQEGAHVLQLLHPDDAAHDTAAGDIARDYKARFRQESVLRKRAPACVGF